MAIGASRRSNGAYLGSGVEWRNQEVQSALLQDGLQEGVESPGREGTSWKSAKRCHWRIASRQRTSALPKGRHSLVGTTVEIQVP